MQRVWDKYLTAEEREWTAARRRPPFTLAGRRAALLMVDLYRGGFGDTPEPLLESVKKWPWSCGEYGWKALPRIVELLETCREAGMPIVHVTMRDPSDGLLGWIEARNMEMPGALIAEELSEEVRRATEIIDEVAPRPGEPVVTKSAPSAFWGTPLIGHLKYLGIDTVIVAGMATAGCIRATVVDAAANRLQAVVPEECVFDRIEASHAMTLFDLHFRYADVVPTATVLDSVRGAVKTAAVKKSA